MANSPASSILNSAWSILRTSGSSTDIPALQESFMLTLCNQANAEWLRAFRRGGGTGPLSSLAETGFNLVADTSATLAVSQGATSFTVGSITGWDTSNGAGVMWNNFMPDQFFYISAAALTFSGVTNISFDHNASDVVQFLYKLPTNMKTPRNADAYGDGVQYNGIPLRFREGPPTYGYFTIIDNGTNKWLWLPRNSTGKISILYEKNSTTIASTADLVDVPPENEFFLVWRIVQYASIPKAGGMPTALFATAKQQADTMLRDALADKDIGSSVRVRPFRLIKPYRDPSLWIPVPR